MKMNVVSLLRCLALFSLASSLFGFRAPDTGFVSNVSSLGVVGNNFTFTVGFVVVEGTTTAYFRATGPSLRKFGVNSPASKVKFKIYDAKGVEIESALNVDQGLAELAVEQLGGFPIVVTDKETLGSATLVPGAYTMVCESSDANPGYSLCEVYFNSKPGYTIPPDIYF